MVIDPLSGDATSFLRRGGTIAERGERFLAWQRERESYGLRPEAAAAPCLAFTGRDALALAAEPVVVAKALEALERCAHLGGVPKDRSVAALESALAALLDMPAAVAFASGTAALSGTMSAVVGQGDFIVLDDGVGPALRHAAAASGARVLRLRAGAGPDLGEVLRAARRHAPQSAILVATETLSITHAAQPDIADWRAACDAEAAALLVDATHDLGTAGPGGTGLLGMQGALALPDIVAGSLGRGFAASGGFACFASPAVAALVRSVAPVRAAAGPILPWCAAAALAALELVVCDEGAARRASLAQRSRHLRARLGGLAAPGPDAAVVLLPVTGAAVARRTMRRLHREGIALDLVEPPLAPRGRPLLRMRLSVRHAMADIDRAAASVRMALAGARDERGLYLPPQAVPRVAAHVAPAVACAPLLRVVT